MKFLLDNYTNNETITETKVKLVASYLPKVNATQSQQANARWYVSCNYTYNHHPTYPHNSNGFNVADNIAYN